MEADEYMEALYEKSVDPEVELALLCFLKKRNLRVLYTSVSPDDEGGEKLVLNELSLDLGYKEPIQFMLNSGFYSPVVRTLFGQELTGGANLELSEQNSFENDFSGNSGFGQGPNPSQLELSEIKERSEVASFIDPKDESYCTVYGQLQNRVESDIN